MKTTHYIVVNNKKHSYSLNPASKESTQVICEAANINQEFLNEDIPELLNDLANLIIAEKKHEDKQNTVIRFRVSTSDKQLIEKNAAKLGYPSISSYLKAMSLKKV